MAESNRKPAGRFRLLGVLALLIGVVGAVALWFVAGKRYDDAVAELAPAPIGCDTTLVFDRTGTYTFFVETKGTVGEIEGDCDNDDREYDVGDGDLPRVELTLLDEDGAAVDLDRADGPSYDRGGSAGQGIRTANIEVEGDYVLSSTADDDEVMIRVGRDPANGVTAMRIGAVALFAAGVVLAIVAFWKGRAQWSIPAQPAAGPTSGAWPPHAPTSPPIAPPYANPPTPPPYAPPGAGRQLPPPSSPPSR